MIHVPSEWNTLMAASMDTSDISVVGALMTGNSCTVEVLVGSHLKFTVVVHNSEKSILDHSFAKQRPSDDLFADAGWKHLTQNVIHTENATIRCGLMEARRYVLENVLCRQDISPVTLTEELQGTFSSCDEFLSCIRSLQQELDRYAEMSNCVLKELSGANLICTSTLELLFCLRYGSTRILESMDDVYRGQILSLNGVVLLCGRKVLDDVHLKGVDTIMELQQDIVSANAKKVVKCGRNGINDATLQVSRVKLEGHMKKIRPDQWDAIKQILLPSVNDISDTSWIRGPLAKWIRCAMALMELFLTKDKQLMEVAEKKEWFGQLQKLQSIAVGESRGFLNPEFQLISGRLACISDAVKTLIGLVKRWDKNCELKFEKTKLINMKEDSDVSTRRISVHRLTRNASQVLQQFQLSQAAEEFRKLRTTTDGGMRRCVDRESTESAIFDRMVGLIATCLRGMDGSLAKIGNDKNNGKRVKTCKDDDGGAIATCDPIRGWREYFNEDLTTEQIQNLLHQKIAEKCVTHEALTDKNMTSFLAKSINDACANVY